MGTPDRHGEDAALKRTRRMGGEGTKNAHDRGTTRRAGICEPALSYGQVHAAWTWWCDVRVCVRVRACICMYMRCRLWSGQCGWTLDRVALTPAPAVGTRVTTSRRTSVKCRVKVRWRGGACRGTAGNSCTCRVQPVPAPVLPPERGNAGIRHGSLQHRTHNSSYTQKEKLSLQDAAFSRPLRPSPSQGPWARVAEVGMTSTP